MVVCDGLTGLPDAVAHVWPQALVQTCIVHLIRGSFRYAARQDWDKIARALKPVYTAPTESAAMERWLEFAEEWGTKYPAIVRLWENAWPEFTPFLQCGLRPGDTACGQRSPDQPSEDMWSSHSGQLYSSTRIEPWLPT
jgi:transposase-like protein